MCYGNAGNTHPHIILLIKKPWYIFWEFGQYLCEKEHHIITWYAPFACDQTTIHAFHHYLIKAMDFIY